jgi:hypothetical protein
LALQVLFGISYLEIGNREINLLNKNYFVIEISFRDVHSKLQQRIHWRAVFCEVQPDAIKRVLHCSLAPHPPKRLGPVIAAELACHRVTGQPG